MMDDHVKSSLMKNANAAYASKAAGQMSPRGRRSEYWANARAEMTKQRLVATQSVLPGANWVLPIRPWNAAPSQAAGAAARKTAPAERRRPYNVRPQATATAPRARSDSTTSGLISINIPFMLQKTYTKGKGSVASPICLGR